MISAIYSLVLLGIYVEMVDGLENGENIVFGGAIDLGSKIKKKQRIFCCWGKVLCLVKRFSHIKSNCF